MSRVDPHFEGLGDSELMRAVGSGRTEALGVLFRRHAPALHSLCYRMTGHPSAAEDLVQETFLRVLRYRRSFRGESRLSTWLYRIARNVCVDYLAKAERQRTVSLEQAGPAGSPAPPPDPRIERLERALLALPPEKREVLVLSRYHDLSYDEIASICGCSVSAVKVRVHRGIRELRSIFSTLEAQDHEMRRRQESGDRLVVGSDRGKRAPKSRRSPRIM